MSDVLNTAVPVPASKPARFTMSPGAARIAFILAVLIVWEVLGHTVLNANFISPPSVILGSLPRVLGNPQILKALWDTLYELIVAFVISVVAGVLVGIAIGANRIALKSVVPMILLAYSIPQITILPIFTLVFGIGPASKIAFGVSHGIFPIALNVIAGMQTVERTHLTFARSLGASRLQVLRRVILPHITPSLFSGLRLTMSATLLGVVLAELYISTGGIGYYTRLFSDSFDPGAMFALVSVLGLMAVVLNEIVRRAERRASFWTTQNR